MCFTVPDIIQLGVLIAAVVSVFIAFRDLKQQFKLTEEQMKLNFFADYTKRYQEIILNFPENINNNNFDFEILKVENKELYNKTLRYMRAYFDLSSEEYYLAMEDRIDKKIWKEWSSGINYTFSKPAFQQAWKIVNLDSKFYSDFVKYIDSEVLG